MFPLTLGIAETIVGSGGADGLAASNAGVLTVSGWEKMLAVPPSQQIRN